MKRKRSLWVVEAGHDDFILVAGERYVKALRDFEGLLRARESSREN